MAITHASPGTVFDVRPLKEEFSRTKTRTLIKTDLVQVIRLVLPAGKEIAEHQAPYAITVQCLEGKVQFNAYGQTHELTAGDMLFLDSGDPHAVQAIEDSSLLLTKLSVNEATQQ